MTLVLTTLFADCAARAELIGAMQARDLTPVTMKAALSHKPVDIVKAAQPVAKVYLAEAKPSATLQTLVAELQTVIKLSTGAELERVTAAPAADVPAIIIGDCPEARAAGLDGTKMPLGGFEVKTTSNCVYLVGSALPLPSNQGLSDLYSNEGTAYAVADFLERFVGVRWYWPAEAGGRTITRTTDLAVPPVHYSDAPVFQMRNHHPRDGYGGTWKSRWFDKDQQPPRPAIAKDLKVLPLTTTLLCLRAGNTWPSLTKVHEPQRFWSRGQNWRKQNEALFAIRKDGKPSDVLCYSSQAAFDFLISGCEDTWDKGKGVSWVTEQHLSISPGDEPMNCQCPECQKLWDPNAPSHGSISGQASKILGTFVKKACEEVKKRWPEKKVVFLPYWNYALCPAGIDFPDNLRIEMCSSAMAGLRQPELRKLIDQDIRAWAKQAGGKISTWEYTTWVTGWTHAPVQFPHVAQDYYRANREILVGSFINGENIPEWSRNAPTLYCIMKVLWNPDVNIDAILDEMCIRLYGKGAVSARKLLGLMCDRWEKASWRKSLSADGHLSPVIFADTWPPEVVAEMEHLWRQAREEMQDDEIALQRFDYWNWTFEAFLKEAQEEWAKAGQTTP
jgi:hypothetical protein